MTPLRQSLAVLGLLSIWIIQSDAGCGKLQREIKGQCCDLCPPGHYMEEFCSGTKQTVCRPCPANQYSNQYNIFDRCEKCDSCQEYDEKCESTRNAKCSCRDGFLCSDSICSKCEENKCSLGERPNRTDISVGTNLIKYSYKCEPMCPDDSYFDVKDKVCKPRAKCSVFGLAEQFPGNKTHNSICGAGEWHRKDGEFSQLTFGIGLVLVSLTLLVVLSYSCIKNLRKRKAYDKPTDIVAVCTNVSDFHLSKEESGHQLIIQDESKDCLSLAKLQLETVLEEATSLQSQAPL